MTPSDLAAKYYIELHKRMVDLIEFEYEIRGLKLESEMKKKCKESFEKVSSQIKEVHPRINTIALVEIYNAVKDVERRNGTEISYFDINVPCYYERLGFSSKADLDIDYSIPEELFDFAYVYQESNEHGLLKVTRFQTDCPQCPNFGFCDKVIDSFIKKLAIPYLNSYNQYDFMIVIETASKIVDRVIPYSVYMWMLKAIAKDPLAAKLYYNIHQKEKEE